ncbi:MAG: NAD(+) synthase [Bacteroidota bacterium]|nr:NAD(+) synthase [Bacteroidota bacterium]
MNTNFEPKKVNDYIVNWLKEYAIKSRVKGFVIGISGGIDSAVTSCLCAQTDLPVLCVELPIHQAESQVNRAKEHIDYLKKKYPNVSSVETNLTSTFDEFCRNIPQHAEQNTLDLTLANTRSRLRMLTLYYYAGIHSALVVGTGNKIEDFGIGFFTKYGDGGVDINPIADLMKSEVYKIGIYQGVPSSVIKAKPTDGLFGDDRTDEDQIGASYDELEKAMIAYQNGKTTTDFEGREKEVFDIFVHRNKMNQHKMNPIPVCIIPENL